MALPENQEYIINWSMTELSPCLVCKVRNSAGIREALATARAEGLSVIPHGAGHSYTDAALNTNGVIIDVTGMRRILAWDSERGIMQVEPGATLRDVIHVALADGWWPPVTPSTAEATIGGCVAMNVNGKNAWKCGSFGEHSLSLTVLLASGQELTLSPKSNPQLFRAFVGSSGLLGIITSITLQLRRITSENVNIFVRSAASLGEVFTIFSEEQSADFQEAWIDGFAGGRDLGRGIVTCAKYSDVCKRGFPAVHRRTTRYWTARAPGQLKTGLATCSGKLCRPVVQSGVHRANSLIYWSGKRWNGGVMRQRSLFHYTYYPPVAFRAYRTLLPLGTETFQAFVPRDHAEVLFKEILRRSQENHFMPLWCVIKQHREDPFLLSYQVDGFSLELNYAIAPQTVQRLRKMLRELMELVIAASGKFYLAKDSLLTNILYRRSVGDAAVETFLHLKRLYDPEMLFQSDLFRRVFREDSREIGDIAELTEEETFAFVDLYQ
ncbi:MAG TPA: FAD-binding oxidoreductase [Ktedonobacteraceae bacterium]|nr:FAD-binding oxidoreductase [Ktedonobacteraceae bacterium]